MKQGKAVRMEQAEEVRVQEFLDMIAPSVVKFYPDYFICGNTFRCVWALREYPTSTQEQAILKRLGEKDGVTLRIYTRHVNAVEERKIISNATSKNRMHQANTNDLQQNVLAESNLQDMATIVAQTHRNREPLLHTAVYIELVTSEYDQLKLLQTEVLTELIRSKLNVDRLLLRQQQGFRSVMPSGRNVFRDQFERVLPASSVANLYPFNYSGKTDPHGFYVGRDKFGSNVLVDFNQRAEDKTNGSVLILGNSGQGKSYLLKQILCNLRESGMHIICLDPEMEYQDLTENLQGCFIDLMSGAYIINPLEPKVWDEGDEPKDTDAPETFRIRSRLSQHISFLKDFFRSYKDFTDREIDVIEIMLQKLYASWGLTDDTNFQVLSSEDYPMLSEFYDFIEAEYTHFDVRKRQLYTEELLQNILLGLHSMCKGAEAKFFNGHTNITDDAFITFGVKGLLQASKNLKNALLFNILSKILLFGFGSCCHIKYVGYFLRGLFVDKGCNYCGDHTYCESGKQLVYTRRSGKEDKPENVGNGAGNNSCKCAFISEASPEYRKNNNRTKSGAEACPSVFNKVHDGLCAFSLAGSDHETDDGNDKYYYTANPEDFLFAGILSDDWLVNVRCK